MTDAALIKLARRYKEQDAAVKEEEQKKERLKAKLLAEMERRNTKAIEHGGVKLTVVSQTYTEYDYPGLLSKLTAEQRRLVTVRQVDPEALASAVTSGQIPLRLVDRYSTIKNKRPYPLVNY